MSAEPHAACGRCHGIGFVYETEGGRERVKPCACHKGLAARPKDPIEACRIPSQYRSCTLGNFAARETAQRDAYERALAYCNQFPAEGSAKGLGLVFWGANGTGKTHLAVGVLQELVANRGISGRFWDFGALVKEIGRCYDKNTLTTVMDTLRSTIDVELLLLDDLASRRMADWAHNTLFEIVNARYLSRRPTLVTTAFEDADREQVLGADPRRRDEFLIERIGQPVRSRLLEMCAFVPMQSQDAREAQREPQRPSTLAGMRRREGSS